MAEQHFHVVFDGPALQSGSMDVRQLAPALLALGEMYQEAQRILYPDDQPLSLEVRATATGSFDVHLALTQSLWQQAVSMFSGDTATAIADILAYTTATTGVVGFLLAARRRKIRLRETTPNGTIRITFDDGTTFECPSEVLRLTESMVIRRALTEVVAPLDNEGITSVRFERTEAVGITVSSEQVDAFSLPPTPDEMLTDTVREEVLSLAAVAFTDGNKWRLTDGERTFFAAIEDQQFIDRVSSDQVRFAKHDLLRVRLRVQQWRTDGGLRTEYSVGEVLEHIPAARPVPLPFDPA